MRSFLLALAGCLLALPAFAFDPTLCEKMKKDLAAAQAEYKSDEARLQAHTPDEVDSKTATLAHDQKLITLVEVQMSAEGCPGAKPVADAPAAIGGGGSNNANAGKIPGALPGTTATNGPGKPGGATDPAAVFAGDYDTHTELGLLHLQADPYAVSSGFEMTKGDYRGPAINTCVQTKGTYISYIGYFKPSDQYQKITDYGMCMGVCVMACVGADGKLAGKFSDRIGVSKTADGKIFLGTFSMDPPVPDERYIQGSYKITGTVNSTTVEGIPAQGWALTRQ